MSGDNYPFGFECGEVVFPGHPDKLSDAIADSFVERVFQQDRTALVGIEVAVSLKRVFITGRIAARGEVLEGLDLSDIARRVYRQAGYGVSRCGGRRITWEPAPEDIAMDTSGLLLEVMGEDERRIRRLSDDQSITVGYAVRSARTNHIPRAQWLAWKIMDELQAQISKKDMLIGPDGKLLCEVDNRGDGWRLTKLVVSMMHNRQIDWSDLNMVVYRALYSLKKKFRIQGIKCSIDPGDMMLMVNGHGDFTTGGPMGDNGLSGKKLVVDAYGPHVPIGGGAYSGKDPHKVDRVGPMLAREMALRAVFRSGSDWERVTLTWAPGSAEYISAELVNASEKDIGKITSMLPRTIDGCCRRYFEPPGKISLVEYTTNGWFSGRRPSPWEPLEEIEGESRGALPMAPKDRLKLTSVKII